MGVFQSSPVMLQHVVSGCGVQSQSTAFPALGGCFLQLSTTVSLRRTHAPLNDCETLCSPRPRHSANTRFRESRGPQLFTIIPLGQWANWKQSFVLQFVLSLPLQWGCQLSWHRWGLASRLWLSPRKTGCSASLYGIHYLQRSARPCESFSPASNTWQGLSSRIPMSCLRIPWVPMSLAMTSPLSPCFISRKTEI